ncbi:hypothetical protein [Falsiroseomonas sp. HW251]|uniref:hypothetical protein n=1 Tax=Falsiroseomonas sp. HW251 TaxID=3390998 RepID=UPI003D321104
MSPAWAIAATVATIALGVLVGAMYLQRARRHRWTKLHLYVALSAVALVTAVLATGTSRGGGPPSVLPLLMLAAAVAIGYAAPRIPGIRRRGVDAALAVHIVVGIAGFFVLLAWAKTL